MAKEEGEGSGGSKKGEVSGGALSAAGGFGVSGEDGVARISNRAQGPQHGLCVGLSDGRAAGTPGGITR